MEAKEILHGMSKGRWDCTQSYVHQGEQYIAGCLGGEGYAEEERDRVNAQAICLAVNSTFGKGYDPTKMEAMYKKLESVALKLTELQEHEEATEIFVLLSVAKL